MSTFMEHCQNPDVMFRVYDAWIQLSSQIPLERIRGTGLLDGLSIIDTSDILLALNIVESYAQVLKLEDGFNFLERLGAIHNLVGFLSIDATEIDACLLVCGIIKFFALVVDTEENVDSLVKTYHLLPIMENCLAEGVKEVENAVLTFVGNLGASPAGIKAICQSSILEKFCDVGSGFSGDRKMVYYQAISCILSKRY